MHIHRPSSLFELQAAATNAALADVLARRGRRVTLILPTNSVCLSSIAQMGCPPTSTCWNFIHGRFATSISSYVEGLQHNVGLARADMGVMRYGDKTDIMGDPPTGSSTILCHNAPHSYRRGWATHAILPREAAFAAQLPLASLGSDMDMCNTSPEPAWVPPATADSTNSGAAYLVANLTADRMPCVGRKMTVLLPAAGTTSSNFISINMGVLGGTYGAALARNGFYVFATAPTIYLGYRVTGAKPSQFDSGLPAEYSMKVHVHQYNYTRSKADAWDLSTNLVGAVGSGGEYSAVFFRASAAPPNLQGIVPDGWPGLTSGGLRVWVGKVNTTAAEVVLCRITHLKEEGLELCFDGLDNDCDGQMDGDDPKCAASMQPSNNVLYSEGKNRAPLLLSLLHR